MSVLTVVFFFAWWLVWRDGRDLITGFRLDLSMAVRGTFVPTLLAHAEHHEAIDLGWTTPFPRSLDQFDWRRVTARMEIRRVNFTIRSYRFPSI